MSISGCPFVSIYITAAKSPSRVGPRSKVPRGHQTCDDVYKLYCHHIGQSIPRFFTHPMIGAPGIDVRSTLPRSSFLSRNPTHKTCFSLYHTITHRVRMECNETVRKRGIPVYLRPHLHHNPTQSTKQSRRYSFCCLPHKRKVLPSYLYHA